MNGILKLPCCATGHCVVPAGQVCRPLHKGASSRTVLCHTAIVGLDPNIDISCKIKKKQIAKYRLGLELMNHPVYSQRKTYMNQVLCTHADLRLAVVAYMLWFFL